jgi:sortase A
MMLSSRESGDSAWDRSGSFAASLRGTQPINLARLLRAVKLVGWGFGILALAYCMWVVAVAALYQSSSREALQHLREQHPRPWSSHSKSRPGVGSVLADLDIPRIGLSVMVVEGTDEHALRLGAGHLVGSGLPGEPGNVVIAAHRDTFFRSLRNIRVGDTIDLAVPEGTYSYQVDWTRVVEAADSHALDPTARRALTLITCYPFSYLGSAPDRFVVRASISEGKRVPQPTPKAGRQP